MRIGRAWLPIGRAAARRRGKVDKHGIKQFDRYLSNDKVRPQVFLPRLARRLLAARKEVVVMIDWTEFAPDDHSTIVISMVTRHGRATPAGLEDGAHLEAQETARGLRG
jgi:hypothetical protein